MVKRDIAKLIFTGADLKALMTSPSTNVEETVRLVSGLLGAYSGDTVLTTKIIMQKIVPSTISCTLMQNPLATLTGGFSLDSGFTQTDNGSEFLAGGNLDAKIKVYDDGLFLSDIPDSTSITIYIECAVVS